MKLEIITAHGEIKELQPGDPEFDYFISTEGQLGVVWSVTVQGRAQPAGTRSGFR